MSFMTLACNMNSFLPYVGVICSLALSCSPLIITVPVWGTLLITIASVSSFFFFALKTPVGQNAKKLYTETRHEMKKVVWPSKSETNRSLVLVLAFVAFSSAFFWIADSLIAKFLGFLLRFFS